MRIESIQTGQPKTMGWDGAQDPLDRRWTSAIWKEPVHGQVWAGSEGLTGDAVASPDIHGGPERALLLYSFEHYPRWRAEWGRKDVGGGAFGENLTVSGLDEQTVCVGDVFQVGEVRIEVSGPREPSFTLVRRFRIPDLAETVQRNHRTGWYVRVLIPGWLEAGLPLALVDRPFPHWTVRRAAEVEQARREDPAQARLLAACPALLSGWRARLVGTA
jgi:MOSC domain-containing protein YiiM